MPSRESKQQKETKEALNDLYSEALCDFTKLFKEKRRALASKKMQAQKKADQDKS